MRIILILLIPFFGQLFNNSEEGRMQDKSEQPAVLLMDSLKGKASYIVGEYCDYTTVGAMKVDGVTATLTELGPNIVHESVSDANGTICLAKPMEGLISYEGQLPDRFFTDALLSNPRYGVTTFDRVLLNRFLAGIDNMCTYTRFSADVNQDGLVDITDSNLLLDIIIFNQGTSTNPFPFDLWRLVPKFNAVPSQTHPDAQYLADYWDNQMVQNSVTDHPFVAELDVLGDHYDYQGTNCSFIEKVKQWDYVEAIEGCSANSFDFYVGKVGDFNGSVDPDVLDGTTASEFAITCNTPQDERYFEVIPYQDGYIGVGYANVLLEGFTESVLVTRMNNFGEIIWAKTVGGVGADQGRSVVETSDGNLFITANTLSFATNRQDLYVIKMDGDGNILWQNSFEGSNTGNPFPGSYGKGIETSDGGFIIGARTGNFGAGLLDFYIIKIDSMGQLEWSNTYGGSNNDWISSMVETADGGFIALGTSSSFDHGYHDMFLIKVDSLGAVVWQKYVGNTSNESAGNLTLLPNGNFIVTGSFGDDFTFNTVISKAVVMEFDADANLVWGKSYYGDTRDVAYRAHPVPGGYLVLGRTNSFNGSNQFDAMLFKIDLTGNLIWTRKYGDDLKDSGFLTINEVSDNEFILGGFTRFIGQDWDLFMHKVDSTGDVYDYCEEYSPNLLVVDTNPQITNSNLTVNPVNQQAAVNGFVTDFEIPCYPYCEVNTGPLLLTSQHSNAVRVKFQNEPKSGRQKARVSIKSKQPIEAFGFGLKIDVDRFHVSNFQLLSNNLPLYTGTNNSAYARENGEFIISSSIDIMQKADHVKCESATPIFEIEGIHRGGKLNGSDLIRIAENLHRPEFISNGKLLSADDYEVIVEWVN